MSILSGISVVLIGLLMVTPVVGHCQAPPLSRATATLLLSAGNWSAMDDNGAYKEIGASGGHEIMMELQPVSPHFELHFIGYQFDLPLGATVPVKVAFDGGETFSFATTQIFNGIEAQNDLYVQIPDEQVALWTHDFTALPKATIIFPGSKVSPWIFDLSGTTPTVTAMAEAMSAAGINGLPPPWATQNSAASSNETVPQQPQADGGSIVTSAPADQPQSGASKEPPDTKSNSDQVWFGMETVEQAENQFCGSHSGALCLLYRNAVSECSSTGYEAYMLIHLYKNFLNSGKDQQDASTEAAEIVDGTLTDTSGILRMAQNARDWIGTAYDFGKNATASCINDANNLVNDDN